MNKNTPDLWDKVWQKEMSQDNDIFIIQKEEHSIRWIRMSKIMFQQFNSFDNLKVIEIGAGRGTHAVLMAKNGADVTVLTTPIKLLQELAPFSREIM